MEETTPQNEPGWVFAPGGQATPSAPAPSAPPEAPSVALNDDEVQWTASEYLANPKSAGWFGILAVGSIVLAIVVWIITGGDIVSTAVIPIVGLIVGIFAARQPRTLTYRLDNHGLNIGERLYPYESFKSFSVGNDHAIGYISLQPLKRFMPPLIVHYAPEDEARIAETLADFLPYEDHKNDVVENVTRRLRF